MYDAGYGSEYWILKQVESLNALLKKLKDELVVEKGIEDILSLDKIAKDFKEPDDGVELGRVRSRVISALGAFTAAAGVANGGVGAASGMLGGIFGATEAKQEISDKTKLDLQAAVLGTFKKLRSSLENIQNNALGRGDQKDLPAAAQTEDGVMTDTARFFAHGKWFIKANGDEVKNFIDKAKTWMVRFDNPSSLRAFVR